MEEDIKHCVTMAIFRNGQEPQVLTIVRGGEPCKGETALPGGFVNDDEEWVDAAARETAEEVGLDIDPEILEYIGDQEIEPGVDHLYSCILDDETANKAVAGSDARDAKWMPLRQVPSLAFHHSDFLNDAIEAMLPNEDIKDMAGNMTEDIRFNNGLVID
jgi:8-oxo-dGTP diphosphatase